jgi:hypothetical protein
VEFTVSSTFLLVVSGDIKSGESWLITLLASFVITAVHYGLLRPKKKPVPGNRKGPATFETYNRNAAGISKLTSKLSIGSAEVSAFVDKLAQSIKQDQEHLTRISDSCGQLSNLTDQKLPKIQEPILASHEDILYVVAQDVNSYLPTYNDALCQPLTGDYETDLANNRTKKIYDDRVGKRASKNIKPFLLQTYKRDIGDALHDLSVPIYVKERHWGCLRVGFKAKTHES